MLQDDQGFFMDYDDRTKKHLREMNALVNHNIYLSQYGKKFYIAMVSLLNLKLSQKIIYTVNFLYGKLIHRNLYNQKIIYH